MTDKKTEALKLALEAVEWMAYGTSPAPSKNFTEIAETIREALAEQPAQQDSTCNKKLREQGKAYPRTCKKCGLGPCIADRVQPAPVEKPHEQQEPVAWLCMTDQYSKIVRFEWETFGNVTPLYTSPPASKPWVGLTDEEIEDAWPFSWRKHESVSHFAIYHAIEAKLKEKNT